MKRERSTTNAPRGQRPARVDRSLGQPPAAAEETQDAAPLLGSGLRAALSAAGASVESVTLGKMEGLYESMFDARWGHVLEVPDGSGGAGMEPREGRPPEPWGWKVEGATVLMDDGAAQFSPPRPRLLVLTSEREWPYAWSNATSIRDCYVYSEVERVWQIVRGDLDGSLGTHGGANSAPVRRVLTGTSGIGKSMAACSYLLYQLLHYDAEQLPTVAYFVGSRAFLFDKATKTMSRLPRLGSATESLLEVATRTRGYIICDVMWGKRQALSVKLPPPAGACSSCCPQKKLTTGSGR
ncbi:retrotransposon hot spot (RHS) protein, partial [Trypanosoma conorhini]